MLTFDSSGSFNNTEAFLKRVGKDFISSTLAKYGEVGVQALSQATPQDTGKSATSWGYEVTKKGSEYSLIFTNSHFERGIPIVIIVQYGHGTKNGGYVQPRDFINPAIKPILDKITSEIWTEVTK